MRAARVVLALASLALAGARAHAAAPQAPVPGGADAVLGLSVRGVHRAYPAALFGAGRVMNDLIGGMEIAVFYDAERRVSSAWFRTVLGEPIEFSGAAVGGVADDLTTITRWDMAKGIAVGGNLVGQRLVAVPVTTTSWADWSAAHPDSQLYRP